jgi:hypothetical protein
MRPAVYVETTIPSFLKARDAKDVVLAGKQEVTRRWWAQRRHKYELFISQLVHDEAARVDGRAAGERLDALAGIAFLAIDEEVLGLSDAIVRAGIIPEKAHTDAGHIALAARHGMDFLLTWNCRHIANAEILDRVQNVFAAYGYKLPVICTPDELFGINDDEP